jgi:hypothetical protein
VKKHIRKYSRSQVIWLAAMFLAFTVAAVALPACGGGDDDSTTSTESSSGTTLPQDVLIPLDTAKKVVPELSKETESGADEGALGTPTGTRSATYASADGSQRLVISVAQYPSSDDAAGLFGQAVQGSLEAPGGAGERVSGLGDEAFIGTSSQGDETHVGGGARYGDLIVNATLQGYEDTKKNRAKVTDLIALQATAAQQAL